MAEATRNYKNVPRIPQPVVYDERPDGVTLKLSEAEAQFLMDVTELIGGDPLTSRRKYSDAVRSALYQAGVKSGYPVQDYYQGAIYFTAGV
jgi:hypothetical protein